ncbi:uncharacterized protein [Diadema antillarum]|uniref:uncharacterized protein n=1 Tax=Diadema antillarum TaxID=105358 RepID=UPI003A8575ED
MSSEILLSNDSLATHEPDHDHEGHSRGTSATAAVTLAAIITVSLAANSLATITILRVRALRENIHNYLILNLNIVSLCITVFSMPFALVSVFDQGALLSHNKPLCGFNGFASVSFPVASSLTVLWIAVDRYLTVVWSKRFPPSATRILLMIVSTWLVSCIIGVLPLFHVLSSYEYMFDTHQCSPIWTMCTFYFVVFFAIYGVTIPVMLLSYVFVVYHLFKKERKMQLHQSFRSKSSYAQSSLRRKNPESSLEKKSDEHVDRKQISDEDKVTSDSGYTSPSEGRHAVAQDANNEQSPGHSGHGDVDTFTWRTNPNCNNSASNDGEDDCDEDSLNVKVSLRRKPSVAKIIEELQKKKKSYRNSKYDSLPRLRAKQLVMSNNLRKAASAGAMDSDDSSDAAPSLSGMLSEDRSSSMEHQDTFTPLFQQTEEIELQPEDKSVSTSIDESQQVIISIQQLAVDLDSITGDELSANDSTLDSGVTEVESSPRMEVPLVKVEDFSGDAAAAGNATEVNALGDDEDYDDDHSSETQTDMPIELPVCCEDQTQEDTTILDSTDCKEGSSTTENATSPASQGQMASEGSSPNAIPVPDVGPTSRYATLNTGTQRRRKVSLVSVSSGQLLEVGHRGTKIRRGNSRRPSMRPQLTADKQVALMGGLLVLTAVICWTPYFIINSCFFPMDVAPHWTSVLAMWLGYVNAMLNPLIYSFTNRRIRTMICRFCGEQCRRLRERVRCATWLDKQRNGT